MRSYDLLKEPWIRARYSDGSIRYIGIKEALKDALLILDILPPVFKGTKFDLYEMVVLRLLSTIIMSAYFKKWNENDSKIEESYAAATPFYLDDLSKNGFNTESMCRYFEEFGDRFDLYSEDHPFLQNPALRVLNAEKFGHSYIYWSPLAPSENNIRFGNTRSITGTPNDSYQMYKMSSMEFAYFLIYTAAIGPSPMPAQYPEESICKKGSVFLMYKGANLAETICCNCVPLTSMYPSENDSSVELADMPVWELDTFEDIKRYSPSEYERNILIRQFWPGISILCVSCDEDGNPDTVVRMQGTGKGTELEGKTVNADITKELAARYEDLYAIRQRSISKPKKDKNNKEAGEEGVEKDVEKLSYVPYSVSFSRPSALCLTATKKADNFGQCIIYVSQNEIEKAGVLKNIDKKICLYYRELDKHCTYILNAGRVDSGNGKTWELLYSEDKHNTAATFQEYYEKCAKPALYESIRKTVTGRTKRKAALEYEIGKARREFADDFEEIFFGQFTEDLEKNPDKALQEAESTLLMKCIRIYEECTSHQTADYIDAVAAKSELTKKLLRKYYKDNPELKKKGKEVKKKNE